MRYVVTSITALLLIASCMPGGKSSAIYDVLISGGIVYDGSSEESRTVDVAIDGDQIVFIGDAAAEKIAGETTIDAAGLIVAPGFIDPHTHTLSDVVFDQSGRSLNGYLTQGVTTVVTGNDGGGPLDTGNLLEKVSERGVGPNFALFVGHGSVRSHVMGREARAPSETELNEMRNLVRQALEEGALGLSTGLYYAPASYAETDEIIALAEIATEYDALYESHIRDESSYSIGLLAAIEEAIDVGRQSGARVHIAHIKALGVDVWGESEAVISTIARARAAGIQVTADQYPWSASGTRISNALIPNWAKADSDDAMYERLRNPENETRLRDEIQENLRKRGGADAILLVARSGGAPSRTLKAEAQSRDLDTIQTAIDIVLEGDSRIASFNMQESDIAKFMRQTWVMTSSDGTNGHPRKFASFPRKYRTYVEELSIVSLAEFINRSTRLTADTLGLCRRGRLEVGYFADIVVFDPDKFGPVADFSNPSELSTGIDQLFINGRRAIVDGTIQEPLYGRALKRHSCQNNKETE